MNKKILVVCTTDSMIWNFLIPHIQYLSECGYTVECACSETGMFFKDLEEKYNLKMHCIDFRRSPYDLKNFSAYKKLIKIIKSRGIDIIYCHEPVGGLMGRMAGYRCKCKVLYMAHGFHFYKGAPLLNKIIYYNVEKFLANFTDALITINDEDYVAASKFKAKKKFKINGIGIDIKKFNRIKNCNKLKRELSLKDDDYVLLSVGELIERKNHIVIIEALRMLDNRNIHYAIAGGGKLESYLKKKINEYGLNEQVHLLGYRNDINELCNSADVFVMPSLQEGLSVALMEAMACGKPIIASKIRGNVDLVDENLGGILVEPKDARKFADSILKGFSSKSDFAKYGEYNVEKVKMFDIETVKKQLADIYDECLKEVFV